MFVEEQKVEKLKPNDAIIMLLDCVNKEDMGKFYQIASKYRDTGCSRGGDAYWRIDRAIKNRPLQMKRLDELDKGLKSLLIQGQDLSGVTYLNEEIKSLIDGLLVEWKNKDLFSYHNIRTRNRILFYGPTGNGKTTIARYIATVSNLPFVEVKSEQVIDSHLGATSTNIFKILNEITEPCILFWDEVDSIGGKRKSTADGAAGHENDRMTNTILTNLDRIAPHVIFIAATNRFNFLDSAFLRRFDVKFDVQAPDIKEKLQFAETMMAHYKIEHLIDELPDMEKFQSYSEVKDAVALIARNFVLKQINQ